MTQHSDDKPGYFGSNIPFLRLMHFELSEVGPQRAKATLEFRPELGNSMGTFHGGVLMSTMDSAMSAAARGIDPENIGVATLDMRTSFLSAAKDVITIEAECIRQGRSIAFCEARAMDQDGTVVATASGTFKLSQK